LLKRVVALLLVAQTAWADRVVALAPFSTLGAEDKSTATRKLLGQIEQAIDALPGTKVVTAQQVADAITHAKKPQLKACEGDTACVAELGKLVGANVVVTGEVGGLGDSRVVYLGATDVGAAKELRSTTLAVGAKDSPQSAAVRLLDPDRYRGTVHFTIDAPGATVYVNGTKAQLVNGEVALPVGTQAVRVTQPQYRDFVRFVDVQYGERTEVPVSMQNYGTIEHDIQGKPRNLDHITYIDPPVWRRWYVTGPAVLVLAIGTGIALSYLNHLPDADARCKVGGGMCSP
jgi:PEGA domain